MTKKYANSVFSLGEDKGYVFTNQLIEGAYFWKMLNWETWKGWERDNLSVEAHIDKSIKSGVYILLKNSSGTICRKC